MDPAVIAAMARWPDVPAVHGWLSLTARGQWRLRGEPIGNTAIVAFIGRNYDGDADGRWAFQNGPQRVFVELAAAPWVLRCGPDGLRTHTGAVVTAVSRALVDPAHGVLLVTDRGAGLVHDADTAQVLDAVVDAAGVPAPADAVEAWLARPADGALWLDAGTLGLAVARCRLEPVAFAEWPAAAGFRRDPAA
jgi:hypothetical protein